MAYNKSERPDASMKRRAGRRRKKFVYSVELKIMKSATKMLTN